MNDPHTGARSFMAGEALPFAEADALWRELRDRDEIPLSRAVLTHLRESARDPSILLSFPATLAIRRELCREEAHLTSEWPFAEMLKDITSTARQDRLLAALQRGYSVQL